MRKIIAAIFILGAGAAKAEEPLPTIHNIPCETVCANSTGLVPLDRPLPRYPKDMLDEGIEGYVHFDVGVTKDGDAGEVTAVVIVGPAAMVRSSQHVVKGWKWKPATLEGKPVAVNTMVTVRFRAIGRLPGASDQVIRTYRQVQTLVKGEKWNEAKALLDEAQAKTNLNLYERGMLSNVSSQIALVQGDYFEARRLSAFALAHSGDVLPAHVKIELWRTRARAAFALGDIVEGLDSFDGLKATKGFDPSSPMVKFVKDARAKVDSMPVFGMSARIPQPRDAEGTVMGLYRRVFAFKDVVGTLDRFVLDCKQQAIESKITDNAEWRIPAKFSECNIRVHGAPGTTFKVVQANP